LQIIAAPRHIPAAAAGAAHTAKSKEIAKNIGKIVEIDIEIRRAARIAYSCMSKAVVS